MQRRGKRLIAIAAALALGGTAIAVWRAHEATLPTRGHLTLFRDEGGCVVGDAQGVVLRWDEQGATIEPVISRLWFGALPGAPMTSTTESTGTSRTIPLERARAIARTFDELLEDREVALSLFKRRTLGVTLNADGIDSADSFDCRANLDDALELQATSDDSTGSWVRWVTHRARLWSSRGEAADPLMDELLAELKKGYFFGKKKQST